MTKAATKKTEKPTALERALDGLTWTQTTGDTWTTDRIPDGEACTPRIKRLSKNSDGTYSYACYRNADPISITRDPDGLEKAKAACRRGTRVDGPNSVLEYATKSPLEIPPFLALTEEERRAVRVSYPWAAPSAGKIERHLNARGTGGADAGDDGDPGTRRLREELAREGSRSAATGRAVVKIPRKARGEAAPPPAGKLERLRDDNPKKAGTGAWKRWEHLFEHCAKGSTVKEYESAKGNMDTLANATRAGYAAVREK